MGSRKADLQSTVDAAPTWPEAIKLFEAWLDKWDLRQDDVLKDAVWVTDGVSLKVNAYA